MMNFHMFYKTQIPFSDFVVLLVTFGNHNIFDKMQFQEAIVMDIKISTYYIPMQGFLKLGGKQRVLALRIFACGFSQKLFKVNEKKRFFEFFGIFLKKYAIGFTRDRTRDLLVTRMKPQTTGLCGMILKIVKLDKSNSCYFNHEFIL